MKRVLISIIVPSYNVELYLSKCINSILRQSFKDIEIIIIDDGSTDHTGSIADNYQKKFPDTIRTIHQPNKGLSNARNKGIELARGYYIGFVDPDDHITPDMYSSLYHAIRKKQSLISYCPFLVCNEYGKFITGKLNGKVTIENMLINGTVSFCNKLYHKDIFKKWGLIPDLWFEDFAYIVPIISNANRIAYVDKPMYHYIKRANSIMGQTWNPQIMDMIVAWDNALSLSPVKYHGAIKLNILKRIPAILKDYFLFWDEFALKAIRYWEELSEAEKSQLPLGNQRFMRELQNKPLIPTKVFIRGFGKEQEERQKDIKLYNQIFRHGNEIIFLDEDVCNIKKNDVVISKYRQKEWDWLALYFALEKIWETGGIYITSDLQVTNYFNYLRKYSGFFSEIKNGIISEKILGAVKGNKYIKLMLQTLEKGRNISHIFSEIPLQVSYDGNGIKMDSNNNAFLGIEDTVLNINSYTSICTRQCIDGLIREPNSSFEIRELLSSSIRNYRNDRIQLERIRKRNAEIMLSTSWKITKPLRKLKDNLLSKNGRDKSYENSSCSTNETK